MEDVKWLLRGCGLLVLLLENSEDGIFRYLSNSIEEIELELPEVARSQ